MRPIRSEALRWRMERRRRGRWPDRKLLLVAICAFLLFIAFELGRGFFAVLQVSRLVSTIEQTPPADVKQHLAKFADRLDDFNPLVRNASITAMRVATGKNLAPMAGAWIAWWKSNENTWQYEPPRPRNASTQP
jgi:hypothetical protein